MPKDICRTCQSPLSSFMHFCRLRMHLIDIDRYREDQKTRNPLDRLSVGEVLRMQGEDLESQRPTIERKMAEDNATYFRSDLSYQVEIVSISGAGFQGVFGAWGFTISELSDTNYDEILEIVNQDPISLPLLGLRRDEIYLCRIVSLDNTGRRYVWNNYKLQFVEKWTLSKWS